MIEKRNPRRWVTALCAAALCLLGALPASGQDPTTYEVTRTARSNTKFTFTMPTNNVEVTVEYVDAGVKITNGETTLYYETLKDAIEDAADNDVIKIEADMTLSGTATVSKNVTLDLNGFTISRGGSDENLIGLNVASEGALTITGSGTFSGFGTAIKNEGMLTLNSLPVFTGNTTDIELADADKVITIGNNFPTTAPDGYAPIKVKAAETNPVTITSGFGNNRGNNPEQFFASSATTRTIRLNASNEAEMVNYTELTTIPVITNNGTDADGSRTASLDEGNVWIDDVLTTSTTAQPGITWQWYRVQDETETAIEGATTTSYTVQTADLGYKIIVKATQPQDIAGIGHPTETIVKVSEATATVVKKDNFDTLTDAAYTLYDTDKVDYVKVELTNASTGVEYIVVADGVTPTELHWSQAVTPESNGYFAISQYVSVTDDTPSMAYMKPSTAYDLYYRLIETDDTKHGTTATTNGKPANEAKIDVKTRDFDYRITTNGVTYELSHDAETGRALTTTTAKVTSITGVAGTDKHAGHKEATILATIPANNTELNARADVWKVLGYDVTTGFNRAIEVPASGFPRNIDMSTFGASAGAYGYLKVMDADVFAYFNNGVQQTQCAVEGYKMLKLNNGFYTLCNATDVYEYAAKGQTVDDDNDNMKGILQAAGMTNGSFVFEDIDGVALPDGTGLTAGHKVAAAGQKVVVKVTLPDGFVFNDGDDNKKLTVSGTVGDIPLAQVGTTNVYKAEFNMPEADVTVKFKETEPLLGREITVTPPATPENGTMTPVVGNPSPIRVFSELKYTLTPDEFYALTDITFTGMPEGFTYTLKDGSDNDVTLPYEEPITLSFQIPAAAGDAVTITPTFTKTYESVTFAAGMTTYFDGDKGLKLHEENANLKFYTISSVGKTAVTLTEIENIPAGTPAIVVNSGSVAATVRMDIGTYDAVTYDPQFKGTTAGMALTIDEGTKYYGFNGKNFVEIKQSDPVAVAAHRCWLELSSTAGARMLGIEWSDGSTTGISGINADNTEDGDWYDLNGRKLQSTPTTKGIYIKNGKKQVVK
ncbi:MAG: hypothetical protein J5952_02025 [Prevotella sp.]|nr:hypothetical protein [Prevotella sp.]